MSRRESRSVAVRTTASRRPAATLGRSAVMQIGAALAALGLFCVPPAQAEIATGPEVGTRIPDIRALDQNGQMRTFEDLRGPEGLLLLFYRTVDW